MSKRIGFTGTLLVVVCFAGLAVADDKKKEEAQAKVDAAKVEVCEKAKKFISDQNAKGKCKAEHEEAQKVTCTAATSKSVTDLQTRCITAKPAKGDKPADDKAAAGGTKCRAVDPSDAKVVIAEADDKLSTKCTRLLIEALQKKWCTAENKGKKFDYVATYDHTIGKTKLKDRKDSLTCRTVAK